MRDGDPEGQPEPGSTGSATGPDGGLLPAVAPVAGALPGLARVAAGAAWQATAWGVKAYVRTGLRVARAVTDPDVRADLARDAADAADVVTGVARSLVTGTPPHLDAATQLGHPGSTAPRQTQVSATTPEALRRRGAELLERSRDVWSEEQGHPAYARILDDLAPDEARILLLLLQGGPQASVDVRTGGPAGLVSSQLVAPGLTMIGARAGVRYPARVPAYLNNLFRLGLVWFSKEPLRDPAEYQVLEAQPDVLGALHSVKFAKVVRRSVHLTPFGEGFCRTVLVQPEEAAGDFPEHANPEAGDAAEPPKP
ncbi:Abi-alpha family protein [Nocardioides cheoyonin]|uniref:Abi-alpha family protein n=1 Tax=Nocardioides cheoyonin TaxID=3156615 RepID=UPI0032B5A5BD